MKAMASETSPDSQMEDTSESKPAIVRCEMCVKREARYRCPGCDTRTCSLPCVLRHKRERQCRGERIKTAYVSVKDFTDTHLLSDLRFLEESARKADLAKKERMITEKAQSFGLRLKTLLSYARQRGVQLSLMPAGLSRHRLNTSMYHFQSQTIQWRVEWYLPQENITFVDERFPEAGIIQDGVESHVQQMLSSKRSLPTIPHSATQHVTDTPLSSPNNHNMELSGSQASETRSGDAFSSGCQSLKSQSGETDHCQSSQSQSSKTDCPHSQHSQSQSTEPHTPRSQESMQVESQSSTPEPLCTLAPQSDSTASFQTSRVETSHSEGPESCLPQGGSADSGGPRLTEALACPPSAGRGCCGGAGDDGDTAAAMLSSPDLTAYTAEGGRQYRVFLKVYGLEANKERYYELDKSLSLMKNLHGKRVIEFPTLHIVPEQAAHSYVPLTADEERQLKSLPSTGGHPYHRRQHHRFRGNRRGRHGPRPQYKDADTYNPNSQIFKP